MANVTPKFANEYLDLIENASGEEKQKLLKEFGTKTPLSWLFSMNFNTTVKFDLPDGMPPYKRDEATHPDFFVPLSAVIERMKNCTVEALPGMKNATLRKGKKEVLFIEILESISPKEADILIHCKDKALQELYPSITPELVKPVFPQYFAK